MLDEFITFFQNDAVKGALVAVVSAWVLFFFKRRFERKSIAKLILQEIRHAEKVIDQFKKFGQFKFTEKVISMNSWSTNTHLFANILDKDELDKISEVYSTGSFLDKIVKDIYQKEFNKGVDIDSKNEEKVKKIIKDEKSEPTKEEKRLEDIQKVGAVITLPSAPSNIMSISANQYQPIYHTTITSKLKKIASSWVYWLFR